MIKSNVISFLKTFSKRELNSFEEFLHSPFHNKNSKVILFQKILSDYHPDYNDDSLTKENLFKRLFGRQKYKESYIRNLLSDLNILAEKFILHSVIDANVAGDKYLIEELNNRDLPDIADKKLRLFEKKIKAIKHKDQDYYMNKIFIYDMKSLLKVDKSLYENYRPDQIMSVIKYFMISIMETSFYLLLEEQRVKIKHDFKFLKHLFEYFKLNHESFKESHLLMVYYHLWLSFFEKNDEQNYFIAKQLFKENFSSFTKIDKKNIYSVLQTFCIKKADKGVNTFYGEMLNVLLEMLRQNVVSHKESNLISLNLYRNIVVLCYNQNETELMKKFISDYQNHINMESRSSILAYSNSHLNFLLGNFEKSLELSNQIDFNDLLITSNENLYFKNDIKKLALKCYYELNSFESALSLIDSYKHFLKNTKLIREDMRKREMNFLNFMNELIKLRMQFDDVKFLMIKRTVNNANELKISHWVNSKLNDLVH